jgi:hypothetical protein
VASSVVQIKVIISRRVLHICYRYATCDVRYRIDIYFNLLQVWLHLRGQGQCNRYSNSLRVGRSGDRILMRARLSSYSMGTGSSSGGKAAGACRWPPNPSNAEVKERVKLYSYSLSVFWWPVLGWTLNYITAFPKLITSQVSTRHSQQ